MAYFVSTAILDIALTEIADLGDRLFVCSEYPTTYTEASTTYMLVSVTLTPGTGNDFELGDGISDGSRRLTVIEQLAETVTNTGNATHIAVCDSVGTDILFVVPCTETTLLAANTIDIDNVTLTLGGAEAE